MTHANVSFEKCNDACNISDINGSNDLDKSIAFQTAVKLVLLGKEQPSGYTEPILHKGRLEFKNSLK